MQDTVSHKVHSFLLTQRGEQKYREIHLLTFLKDPCTVCHKKCGPREIHLLTLKDPCTVCHKKLAPREIHLLTFLKDPCTVCHKKRGPREIHLLTFLQDPCTVCHKKLAPREMSKSVIDFTKFLMHRKPFVALN